MYTHGFDNIILPENPRIKKAEKVLVLVGILLKIRNIFSLFLNTNYCRPLFYGVKSPYIFTYETMTHITNVFTLPNSSIFNFHLLLNEFNLQPTFDVSKHNNLTSCNLNPTVLIFSKKRSVINYNALYHHPTNHRYLNLISLTYQPTNDPHVYLNFKKFFYSLSKKPTIGSNGASPSTKHCILNLGVLGKNWDIKLTTFKNHPTTMYNFDTDQYSNEKNPFRGGNDVLSIKPIYRKVHVCGNTNVTRKPVLPLTTCFGSKKKLKNLIYISKKLHKDGILSNT